MRRFFALKPDPLSGSIRAPAFAGEVGFLE